jgi:2-phosphosulfolactate phosphatase
MEDKFTIDVCFSPMLIGNYDLTNTAIVIIDVVRASSTICTAISYGVEHIIALDDVDKARKMKDDGYITAGERNGDQVEGFDYGNSPISFMDRKLEGKKLAITTTNGTLTFLLAEKAAKKFKDVEILVGAFVNYSKIRNYLFSGTKNVLLVCSGWKGNPSIEDSVLAGKIAEDLTRYGKFRFYSDSAYHAILIYEQAKSNIFNFILDYSVRFKENLKKLDQDIRYCVKENVAEVLPVLLDGKIVNKML